MRRFCFAAGMVAIGALILTVIMLPYVAKGLPQIGMKKDRPPDDATDSLPQEQPPDKEFEEFADRWQAPPTKADDARLLPGHVGQWALLKTDCAVRNDGNRPWRPSAAVRHGVYELEGEKIDVYADRLEEAPLRPYRRTLKSGQPWRDRTAWAKCGNQLDEGWPPDRTYHYAWIKGWFLEADAPFMHDEAMESFFVEYLARVGHTSPPGQKASSK